jgi:histidinol-phosphate/aromatic aminotransferase/cobyric acid decarboxylase-like protein
MMHWLIPASHVLILEPTYGEYEHVLERVIGCTVDRFPLPRAQDYDVDPGRLSAAMGDGYDLVVIVNPNSPTGRMIPRDQLVSILNAAPSRTRIWIDETYIEYAGAGASVEKIAVDSPNIIVCKSMSKVYALSGARVAYLCASAVQLETLRAITPPWVVGLPSQVAAVNALKDPTYYADRYAQTRDLRAYLGKALKGLGLNVVEGVANFLLCHLPGSAPDAAAVVKRCRERNVFIRDAALMGGNLGSRVVRIAVKDSVMNARIVEAIAWAIETDQRPIERSLPPRNGCSTPV